MNEVFQNQLRDYVLVFFDNILIYSPDLNTHCQHLKNVPEILQKHQLYAKKSKCTFEQLQVEYLGHIISKEGVSTELGKASKVEAMQLRPVPKNVKQLRRFLGLTGYYRKFVRNYGIIARP